MSGPQDTSGSSTSTIDALLQEHRVFPPPAAFAAQATMADPAVYQRAADDPDAFWAQAAERLDWFRTWDTVLE
ncbi:MAG TPA: acetyl-coenzyme A synthetase N-terminal domain-containing protein, partial [Ktedonobacterales bacterium]|nr:acetyl-coenzyme A synthetase N-terminal domain-containing protein [Ktedonobacterales bacterium]